MITYIFPFNLIEKGSRISIWGSGKVGQDYWEQIKVLDYCEIIDFVDKNAVDENWIIHSAEHLNEDVDYIVIAVSNPIAIEEIRTELICRKVAPDKIVSDIKFVGDLRCKLNVREVVLRNLWKQLVKDYMDNSLGRFEYLDTVIRDLHDYEDKDYIRNSVKKVISDFSPEEQVVLLRVLMQAECFDAAMMQQYMSCFAELKNKELVVYLLYEIVWTEIAHEEYRYDEYYNDRRNIIKKNTESLLENKTYLLRKRQFAPGQRVQKVCILRQDLPDYSESAATKLAIDWANELAKRGCEVLILVAGYLEHLDVASIIGLHGLQQRIEMNGQYTLKDVYVEKAKGINIADKMCYMLNRLNSFCPDLVIDTCADYEMLSSIVYQYFPLIQIPFRGVNSCTFHHRCIVNSKELFETDWARFHSVKKENAIFLTRVGDIQERLSRIESVERKSGRRKYSISENSFLLASVSNRLNRELNGEFIDCVAGILVKHENIVWILVGTDNFPYIQERYELLLQSGRIILWGYENDLSTFYKRLDISMFIYPKATGNAGCVSRALLSGTAVLTMKCNGDIASVIGIDNMVENDIQKFGSRIEELYYNSGLLRNQWEKEIKYYHSKRGTVENYITKILETQNEIVMEEFMPPS